MSTATQVACGTEEELALHSLDLHLANARRDELTNHVHTCSICKERGEPFGKNPAWTYLRVIYNHWGHRPLSAHALDPEVKEPGVRHSLVHGYSRQSGFSALYAGKTTGAGGQVVLWAVSVTPKNHAGGVFCGAVLDEATGDGLGGVKLEVCHDGRPVTLVTGPDGAARVDAFQSERSLMITL